MAETAWKRRNDEWHGISLEVPAGWKTLVRDGATWVWRPDGLAAALVWPDPAGLSTPVADTLVHVLRTVAQGDPSIQALTSPAEALPGGGERQRAVFSQPDPPGRGLLRGEIAAIRAPTGSCLVTGWRAPEAEVRDTGPVLWRVLDSYAPLQPVPRTLFVDPSEGAWSVLVPQGWHGSGGVDRSGAQGQVVIRWSVDDPQTGARAYNDGVTLPFVAPTMGLGGYPGGGWNQIPFTPAVDLCRGLLLQLARGQRPDLVLHSATRDEALEQAAFQSLSASAARLGAQAQVTGALATTAFGERGRRVREVTAVVTWMMLSPVMPGSHWFATLGPSVRAPEELFDRLEPILSGVVLSYRANEAWESRQVAAVTQRMADDRARAEQQRALMWRETQEYCQRVDREIQAHRDATNAEIRRGQHNLIAGTEDVLGVGAHSYRVESGYREYWERNGSIVGSNSAELDTHLEANGWTRMRVF